jgi:hypothetical protein
VEHTGPGLTVRMELAAGGPIYADA